MVCFYFFESRKFSPKGLGVSDFTIRHPYQNPSGFFFLVQIRAFAFETSLGLPHLNMKGKMILIVLILKESTYLKFPPNPRLCWRVCANISYLRMSLSLTDLRANFMASSKWSRLISGTGSSSSTSYIVTVPFVSNINEHMSNTGNNNNNKWQVFT